MRALPVPGQSIYSTAVRLPACVTVRPINVLERPAFGYEDRFASRAHPFEGLSAD